MSLLFGSSMPIGSIVQSPVSIADPAWVRCAGQIVLRTAYPAWANMYNGPGQLTFTARAVTVAPSSKWATADATNFLIAGAAGTSPIQVSPDSITWSQSATWSASTAASCAIRANTRFVMAGTAGDLTVPYVAAIGQTAANLAAKANWTATTVAGGTCDQNCLAYSPSLGMTLFIPNSVNALTVYTLLDGATAWVARTMPSNKTRSQCCWDGTYFWITESTGQVLTRFDGTTGVDVILPNKYNPSVANNHIASDGVSAVVLLSAADTGSGTGAAACRPLVTLDHGATWLTSVVYTAGEDSIGNVPYTDVYCVNGMWKICAGGTNGRYCKDALSWGYPGNTPANNANAITYKSGVYFEAPSGTSLTTAQTFTEDVTKMMLPRTSRYYGTTVGLTGNLGYQEWIKVA